MTRPLNVLYAVTHGEMGGVHRFLESVFLNHDPGRVRPVVLSFKRGAWLDELKQRGISVHCIDDVRVRNPVQCFQQVSRVIRAEKIDIVHSSYAWCHTLTSPAAAWHGCKRVWFHHGPMSEKRWQGFNPLIPADLVLANSHFLMEGLKRTLHITKRRGVVHYGIDAASLAPDASIRSVFRSSFGLSDETLAVGLVGFIDTWKGQDIFLEAASLLRNSDLPLKMFIIGGPRDGLAAPRCSAFQEQLESYVREQGLEDVVEFTGHIDIKKGALDGLDIFVHASTEPEPFGMVILEAMAKSKAIIASAEGGPCEILTDGMDGLLIKPRSADTLADAIRHLGTSAGKRTQLETAALHTSKTKFHPARAARKLEDLYESLSQS